MLYMASISVDDDEDTAVDGSNGVQPKEMHASEFF